MSISREQLRVGGKSIAQDSTSDQASGVQLLLSDPGDYNTAIDQALAIFQQDRPNLRIVDYLVTVAAFKFVLDGTGEILTGNDAWVDGFSVLRAIWWPFDPAAMADRPNDENSYRVRQEPDSVQLKTVLELLDGSAAVNEKIRLEFTAPHSLHDSTPTQSSIRAGDVQALKIITASFILQMTANKWLQNTGNTGLPNDVVDRRTQSDMARSRAKELREYYNTLVGKGAAENVLPASGFKDLDVEPSYGQAYQWHPASRR